MKPSMTPNRRLHTSLRDLSGMNIIDPSNVLVKRTSSKEYVWNEDLALLTGQLSSAQNMGLGRLCNLDSLYD
jgi:hypothetical protein